MEGAAAPLAALRLKDIGRDDLASIYGTSELFRNYYIFAITT